MPQNTSELAELAEMIDATPLPESAEGIELLAVSHDKFHARWSLTEAIVRKGRQMASPMQNETHLVLRAFSLPPEANGSDVSQVWHDFNIEGTDNSGYFDLPGSANAINAAIGLVNKDGRFSPLLRGESIDLPAAPTKKPTVLKAAKAAQPVAEAGTTAEVELDSAPLHRKPSYEVLDEASIAERLARVDGLPESFKLPAEEALEGPPAPKSGVHEPLFSDTTSTPEATIQHPERTDSLDEAKVLDTVRGKLAAEPEPQIEESTEANVEPHPEAPIDHETSAESVSGASEQLASQWEDLWSANAPIEIRATYILSGKIASGMRLLLGNTIVEPAAGGYFTWKRSLESFDQAWPIIQSALQTPSVAAAPALEFFNEVEPSQRLLEIHGALEIEGRVSDPDYIQHLPGDLRVEVSGDFKLTRMLPDGAVILPGLSLIAG